MKKYKLIESRIEGLYKVQALRSFGDVKEGDVGGYVQGEHNLSHEGTCWIYGNAKVYGNARVVGDAKVYGKAEVSENALVYDEARVYGKAKVFGKTKVHGSTWVGGNVEVGESTAESYDYGAGPNKIKESLLLQGIDLSTEQVKHIHSSYWKLYGGTKE